MNAADSIGRTLARLGQLTSRSDSEPESSRDTIGRLLQEAQRPLTVEDISALTGLHANTIRNHLEMLRAAGRVERTRQSADGRGRPKWLYTATVADPYSRLAGDLRDALDLARDSGTAAEAAQRWRTADGVTQQPVDTPDEAVAVAADALGKLGFDVDVSPVGDKVYLGNCPYAALIVDHPVICDIHARAVEQVLAGTGQDVQLESMDVFPRAGVCVAHLRRGDVQPYRVVPGEDDPEKRSTR